MSNVISANGMSTIGNKPSHYGFGVLPVGMQQSGSLFNTDGTQANKSVQTNTNQGGNNMWGSGANNGAAVPNMNGGWVVETNKTTGAQANGTGAVNPAWGSVTGTQPTVGTTPTNSDVNWGTAAAPIVNNNGQYDKVAAAQGAIKKLAGKLLELVPKMSADEFNEFVKIFDLADIKDEFLARSGRQDSYLDRKLLVEALNEMNMVFSENNQKSSNYNTILKNMGDTLNNTGNYDAGNVYKFVLDCVSMGVLPASIQQDPMRQHLAKVVNMAFNFKNGGGMGSTSGANWNTGNVNTNTWAVNNNPWTSNNNVNTNGVWGSTQTVQTNTWNTGYQAYTQPVTTQNSGWVSGPVTQNNVWGGSYNSNPVQTSVNNVGFVNTNTNPWGSTNVNTNTNPWGTPNVQTQTNDPWVSGPATQNNVWGASTQYNNNGFGSTSTPVNTNPWGTPNNGSQIGNGGYDWSKMTGGNNYGASTGNTPVYL